MANGQPSFLDKLNAMLSTPVGQKAPTAATSPPAATVPPGAPTSTTTPSPANAGPGSTTNVPPPGSAAVPPVTPVVGGMTSYLAKDIGLRALPRSKVPILNALSPQDQTWTFTAPPGYILSRIRIEEDATWTVTAGLGYMSQLHNKIQVYADGAQVVYIDGQSLDRAMIVIGGFRNSLRSTGYPAFVDQEMTTTATQYYGYWEPHIPLRGSKFEVQIDFVAASTLDYTTDPISAGQMNVAVTPVWEPDHGGPVFTFLAQTFNGVPKLNGSGILGYSLGYPTTTIGDSIDTVVTQWTFGSRSYSTAQLRQIEEMTNDLENGTTVPTGAMTGLSNKTPLDPTVADSYFSNVLDIDDQLDDLAVVFDGDVVVTLCCYGQTSPQNMAKAGA
jgi:hypothetical protein